MSSLNKYLRTRDGVLEVINLSCLRGERPLFQDINFRLEPGESLLVTGENGSGKTSLLRTLIGLTPPFSGSIQWRSRPIERLAGEYRRELLYCGHPLALKDGLTAVENLHAIAALAGESVTATAVHDALDRSGLNACAPMPVRALSQGQKRRVHLAKLLLLRRALWVLDEPLTALDVKASQYIVQAIDQHLRGGGIAVLTTHHDMPLACTPQTIRVGA